MITARTLAFSCEHCGAVRVEVTYATPVGIVAIVACVTCDAPDATDAP